MLKKLNVEAERIISDLYEAQRTGDSESLLDDAHYDPFFDVVVIPMPDTKGMWYLDLSFECVDWVKQKYVCTGAVLKDYTRPMRIVSVDIFDHEELVDTLAALTPVNHLVTAYYETEEQYA